jgi:5'-nucleotidase
MMPDTSAEQRRPPRILVTNDDGIAAAGIGALERVARELSDDVWVVAPEHNQSGAGHSLTLRRPLRLRRLSERHVAVDGSPTDCVILALQHILADAPVDLVLSGINHGSNLAEDVTYSGTVAAAMEATLFKVPAVALSQRAADRKQVRWDTAERWAPELLRGLLAAGWPRDVLINVNFPDLAPDEVRGWRVCSQGARKIGDQLVERIDPRGEPYVWIGELRESNDPAEGTDLAAINAGHISVTPVHLDMTHYPSVGVLREALAR